MYSESHANRGIREDEDEIVRDEAEEEGTDCSPESKMYATVQTTVSHTGAKNSAGLRHIELSQHTKSARDVILRCGSLRLCILRFLPLSIGRTTEMDKTSK
jgi:hypothetical protein